MSLSKRAREAGFKGKLPTADWQPPARPASSKAGQASRQASQDVGEARDVGKSIPTNEGLQPRPGSPGWYRLDSAFYQVGQGPCPDYRPPGPQPPAGFGVSPARIGLAVLEDGPFRQLADMAPPKVAKARKPKVPRWGGQKVQEGPTPGPYAGWYGCQGSFFPIGEGPWPNYRPDGHPDPRPARPLYRKAVSRRKWKGQPTSWQVLICANF